MEVLTKLCRPTVRYLILRRYCTSNLSSKHSGESEKDCSDDKPPFSRTGDFGHTVAKGTSLPKNDRIFEAIGTTDELAAYLGFAREFAISNHHPYSDKLTRIQTMLIDITLAISNSNNKISFSENNTKELEEWITDYSKNLTSAENYLLPGGGKASTSLHVARSICRRAERSILPLVKSGEVDQQIQIYLNRLSDLLFTLARVAARRDERSESVYTPLSVREENKKKLAQQTNENKKPEMESKETSDAKKSEKPDSS